MRITKYYYPASRTLSPFTGFSRSPWSGFESEIDRLFEVASENSGPRRFPIDLYEDAQNTYLKADLPGVARDQIAVEVVDGVLSIQANRKEKTGESETNVSYGRSVTLPESVQADRVAAAYENGVLTVTLPKQEQAQPKKVTVAVK